LAKAGRWVSAFRSIPALASLCRFIARRLAIFLRRCARLFASH
jgi:hypothetical protein